MDVRKLLDNPRFRWERRDPAPGAALEALREHGPDNLPVTYLRYLALSDGGGGSIPQAPGEFVLAPAEEVLGLNRKASVDQKLPGYFAFGSGEDTLFLFDLRARDGAPVCSVSPDSLDPVNVSELASSFSDFLSRAMLMNRSF